MAGTVDGTYAYAYEFNNAFDQTAVRAGRAIVNLDRAIALQSDYGDAYPARGDVYLLLGESQMLSGNRAADAQASLRRSVADYRQALRLEPDEWHALWNLGYALGTLKDDQSAIPVIERALEIAPRQQLGLRVVQAVNYLGMGQLDQALAEGQRAVDYAAANPTAADVFHFRQIIRVLKRLRVLYPQPGLEELERLVEQAFVSLVYRHTRYPGHTAGRLTHLTFGVPAVEQPGQPPVIKQGDTFAPSTALVVVMFDYNAMAQDEQLVMKVYHNGQENLFKERHMATHHLDDTHPHAFWDNSVPPRLTIQPGDTVVIEVPDASNYQITPSSTTETLKTASVDSMDQLTGPVYAQGAQPGDALEVEVIRLEHKGWGWSAVIPGFGLLADDFTQPLLHMSRLEGKHCWFTPDIRVPFDPFCGTMGVAPAEPGRFGTIPPRRNGGNLDIRHLTAGTRVRFPVWVPGALFSCGDCHAAQGDGEVNGTGIESPMTVTLRFNLIKDANLPELRFITPPGRRLSAADAGGYYVTTAHGPDLFKNAQQAVRYMLDYLVAEHALSRELAYCLCGVAVDLRISQLVDAPNWMVSAYLPLSIFVKT